MHGHININITRILVRKLCLILVHRRGMGSVSARTKFSRPLRIQHSGYYTYILQPALASQEHRILSTHDGCKFHVLLKKQRLFTYIKLTHLWFLLQRGCVLCELGFETLLIIEIHFLVKWLKCAYGTMSPLASDYSISTHLLVQIPDYI
jgi:hypothetical protein